ncbi:hypothetical protein MTO96_029703 [Rhipicephalus appendiculatus]
MALVIAPLALDSRFTIGHAHELLRTVRMRRRGYGNGLRTSAAAAAPSFLKAQTERTEERNYTMLFLECGRQSDAFCKLW